MLYVSVAQSSSGSIAVLCVLLILWWDVVMVVCMGCRRAKGHRRPECLVCNRQQWVHEGPGARKITSIALRRSTGGSSASWRPPCL